VSTPPANIEISAGGLANLRALLGRRCTISLLDGVVSLADSGPAVVARSLLIRSGSPSVGRPDAGTDIVWLAIGLQRAYGMKEPLRWTNALRLVVRRVPWQRRARGEHSFLRSRKGMWLNMPGSGRPLERITVCARVWPLQWDASWDRCDLSARIDSGLIFQFAKLHPRFPLPPGMFKCALHDLDRLEMRMSVASPPEFEEGEVARLVLELGG